MKICLIHMRINHSMIHDFSRRYHSSPSRIGTHSRQIIFVLVSFSYIFYQENPNFYNFDHFFFIFFNSNQGYCQVGQTMSQWRKSPVEEYKLRSTQGMIIHYFLKAMQQFIEKEIQFSDRPDEAQSQKFMRQPQNDAPLEPCKFSELFRFSDRQDKLLMILGSIFSIANGFSLIFYARPLKDLINAYKPTYNFDQLVTHIGDAAHGFLMNGILVFISCALMNISWTLASQRQLIKIRKMYYKSLLLQELSWYDTNKPEQICSEMYVQTQRAQNTFVESITSMLTCLSMGIGSIIVSFVLGWRLAIVLNAYVPVVVVLNYVRSKYNVKAKTATADLTVKLNGQVFQVFENIKTVKYLGAQDYEVDKYSQSLEDYKNVSIPLQRKMAIIWGITAFFSYASVFALGFWYGTKLVIEEVFNDNTGQLYNVGDVVSIFFCMYISGCNFNPLSGHFANLTGCRVALAKIMSIIDRRPRKSQGFQPCISNIQEIEFKNLTFFYNKPLFNSFNLTIKKGVTALVGTSGNGKSTLLNLLVKFYEPFQGSIILSNQTQDQLLRDVDENSLRQRIGYVGQQPVLLGNTLRQVLLAKDIEQRRIWDALEMSCIADLVREGGLDSPMKAVSGGQKQRLAIARAILRSPEILILDEGTSALDSINERTVLQNLKTRSKIPFIIMIAHRVETLNYSNQIFKIQKGEATLIQVNELSKIMQHISAAQQKIDEHTDQPQVEAEKLSMSEKPLEHSEKDSGESEEDRKLKFKWAYLWRLLEINKKYRIHYIVGIISAVLLGSIFPTFSVILSSLINLGVEVETSTDPVEKNELAEKSHYISILLFIVAILNLFIIIIKEYAFLDIGENLAVVLKKTAFKTTVNLEMAEIDKRGKPSLVHLVNTSAESSKTLASQTISSFVDVSSTLIIGITIALCFCWQITLVALLLIPLIVMAGMLQMKFLTTLSQNSDKIMKGSHEMVLESIVHNKTVASLNLQPRYIKAYELRQDEGLKVTYRNSIFSGLTMALSQCLIAFVICLIYYIAAVLAQNFDVVFKDIFVAIYAVMFSGVQAGTNIEFIGGISSGFSRTAQYFQTVNMHDQQLTYDNPKPKSNYVTLHEEKDQVISDSELMPTSGLLEFKNIYFRYPNSKEYLFQGLSFSVKPGERVAIVGQSGTGKTSVADLLFSIYTPEQGQILLDKVSTKSYLKKEQRPRMAIVSQEPALFNRTVQENIRYNYECSFSDIEEAAKMSDAHDFVEEGIFGKDLHKEQNMHQNNWQRLAGSRGSLFSGGQKQRIAIARALVRKPVVLVMDEATSALDKETEEKVLKNIETLRCSQLIIAHRMSTIRSCDRIVVIKNGRLAEMGTFQELVTLNGQFSRLVSGKKQEKQ